MCFKGLTRTRHENVCGIGGKLLLVSFKLRPLCKGPQDRPQSLYGHSGGAEKNLSLRGIQPRSSTPQPVSILTEPSRLTASRCDLSAALRGRVKESALYRIMTDNKGHLASFEPRTFGTGTKQCRGSVKMVSQSFVSLCGRLRSQHLRSQVKNIDGCEHKPTDLHIVQ